MIFIIQNNLRNGFFADATIQIGGVSDESNEKKRHNVPDALRELYRPDVRHGLL